MDEEKLRKYYEGYTDCWKFFRKWCGQKTDDDWKKLLCEAQELFMKDGGSEMRKKLLEVTLLELNRLSAQEFENGK